MNQLTTAPQNRHLLFRLVIIALLAQHLPVIVPSTSENGSGSARANHTLQPGTVRANVNSAEQQAPYQGVYSPGSLSDDGHYIAFDTADETMVSDDTWNSNDVFVRDLVAGTTSRVSVDSSGGQPNGNSAYPAISGDGRYVAFYSDATDLVAGDTNTVRDTFVRDLRNDSTVNLTPDGNGNSFSFPVAMTRSGRYVAFHSSASNLVPGDTNTVTDLFVRDLVAQTTTAVTIPTATSNADSCCSGESRAPAISDDGRYVAFDSLSSNLVPGDTGWVDVFIKDMVAGTIKRISVDPTGGQVTGTSAHPSISSDGRFVAFESDAPTLVPNDTNEQSDIFLYDQNTGKITRESVSSSGAQASLGWGINVYSKRADISGNGRYIAFLSAAKDLVSPNENNVSNDIFVRDRYLKTTTLLSLSRTGGPANGATASPAISANGRYVSFISGASTTNLVWGDTNNLQDLFVRDRTAHAISISIPYWRTFGFGKGRFGGNPTAFQSDPVNSASGNFVSQAVDFALKGVGPPFEFVRSYTSGDTTSGALGTGWTHNLNMSLNVKPSGDVTFRTDDGQVLDFEKRPDGSFIAINQNLSSLTSVGAGYEVMTKDQIRYSFDSTGRLTSIEDRNGQNLTISYTNGKIASVTDTVGRVAEFTNNAQGLLTNIELEDGRSVSFGYTGGLLTAVTDLNGETMNYSYDASGRLTEIIDQNGNTAIANVYGTNGRVTEQTDAEDNVSQFSWDSDNQISTMTDARGGMWKDEYLDNVLIRRIDPLGNATSYVYDINANLAIVTDALGRSWDKEYGDTGNLLSVKGPSYQQTFAYNSSNLLQTATDARGVTTTMGYDSSGNLISITKAGTVNQIGRDAAGTGLVTSTTDPLGKTTDYLYDSVGNLTEVKSPLGHRTTMVYDAAGRVTATVDPRGNESGATPADYRTTYTYNAAGKVLSQTDPLGNATSFTYDAGGNLLTRTDAKGRVTSYAYNRANELTRVTATAGTITSYAYDASGNLISRTDANGHLTVYEYDLAGRMKSVASPSGQLWTYEYDAVGALVKMTDAIGNSTSLDTADGITIYGRDPMGRTTSVNYSGATPDVALTYDGNGNLTQMIDGGGTELRTYDSLNRLTKVSRGLEAFDYVYDSAGNVTGRTHPDGTAVTLTYSDDRQLTSLTNGSTSVTYTYDAARNLTQTARPSANGYSELRTYDRAGRVIDVRNDSSTSTMSFASYARDQVGNPITVTTTAGVANYAYDLLDRVTEVCYAAACPGSSDPFIRFAYDLVGNRTSETRPSGLKTYSYNSADQMTLVTSSLGVPTVYTYDANGNQTLADLGRRYTYDQANRVSSAIDGPLTTTYSYYGDGVRYRAVKSIAGALNLETTKYTWDKNGGLPQLARETVDTPASDRRFVQGNGLESMTIAGEPHFYHRDGLGSVVNVTDDTGTTEWTYEYEPFGVAKTETKSNPAVPDNPMKFTGEYQDPTGLYHLRARQMDPTTGRFLSTDPLAPAITDPYVAAYVYANNRPTLLVDPSGLRANRVNQTLDWVAVEVATPVVNAWKPGGCVNKGEYVGGVLLVGIDAGTLGAMKAAGLSAKVALGGQIEHMAASDTLGDSLIAAFLGPKDLAFISAAFYLPGVSGAALAGHAFSNC